MQEYLVHNLAKVTQYIDKEIGVDYEITYDDECMQQSGSIVVFDLDHTEHTGLRAFITKESLWSE